MCFRNPLFLGKRSVFLGAHCTSSSAAALEASSSVLLSLSLVAVLFYSLPTNEIYFLLLGLLEN